jgi:hypothetical protein
MPALSGLAAQVCFSDLSMWMQTQPPTVQGHGDRWPMVCAFSRSLVRRMAAHQRLTSSHASIPNRPPWGQIPPPPDWSDWIHICGFFFLDNPNPDWQPDPRLTAFLADRSRKIVYIGFGSIVVDDPGPCRSYSCCCNSTHIMLMPVGSGWAEALTDAVVEAVRLANVKAIVAKGWSARAAPAAPAAGAANAGAAPTAAAPPPARVVRRALARPPFRADVWNHGGSNAAPRCQWPDYIYPLSAVPHDWLFPQLDGVVHHGGAGTTAAGTCATHWYTAYVVADWLWACGGDVRAARGAADGDQALLWRPVLLGRAHHNGARRGRDRGR